MSAVQEQPCRWILAADRFDWLKARHPFIGASETASVLGLKDVHTFSSPYGVWYRKLQPAEDHEPTIEQAIGHALEPFNAECFTKATGKELHNPGDFAVAVSKRYPWLACTIDRFTAEGVPVELKTAKFEAAKEWKSRVPIAYQIQNHVQMIVTGQSTSYSSVILNCSAHKWFEVPYNARFAEALIARTKDFYERCMVGGERPDPDHSDATAKALAALYPKAEGEGVELPDDVTPLGAEYDALLVEAAKVEKRKAFIQNRIKDALGAAPVGRLPDGSGFSWKGDKSRTFRRIKGDNSDE